MKKAFLLLLALSVCAIADNDAASEIPFAVNFDATSEVKSEPAPTVSEVKSEESQEAKTEAKSKPTKAAHKAKPKAKAKASQKSKDEVEAKPEETVFIDDSPHNTEVAASLGLHVLQPDNGGDWRGMLEDLISRFNSQE